MAHADLAHSILPPDDELELLHDRTYQTRVYRKDGDHLLVRGAVTDTKPAGLYIVDDDAPLEIHQMQVELVVALEGLVIVDAKVGFETHPQPACPGIAEHYRSLIGMSIARGYSRKVRELFGGPRGCAHTTALLQAMAPAVFQSLWSVRVSDRRAEGAPAGKDRAFNGRSSEDFDPTYGGNLNTCHIWDEHGTHVADIDAGVGLPVPLPMANRLKALDREPAEWRAGS